MTRQDYRDSDLVIYPNIDMIFPIISYSLE